MCLIGKPPVKHYCEFKICYGTSLWIFGPKSLFQIHYSTLKLFYSENQWCPPLLRTLVVLTHLEEISWH